VPYVRRAARDHFVEALHVELADLGRFLALARHNRELESGEAIENGQDGIDELRRDQNRLGAAILEHVGVLLGGEQRVQRNRDDAGADRAPEGDGKLDGIEVQENDAAFGAKPQFFQTPPESAACRLQLAIGERAVLLLESGLFAVTARDITIDEIGGGIIRPPLRKLLVLGHLPSPGFLF
jgi:hypothetical protein